MEKLFETKNLFLRNLQPEDAPVIAAYRNDPRCNRYQRWEDLSAAAAETFVRTFQNCRFLSEEAQQHYAICNMQGIMLGDLSYFYTREDACVTLGITVAPIYQRRGVAREILGGLAAAIGQRYPGLDIVALIHPENAASLALFESLGFAAECYAESIESWVYVIPGTK